MRIPILFCLLIGGLTVAGAMSAAATPSEAESYERGRILAESLFRQQQTERFAAHQIMELIPHRGAPRVRELYVYRRSAASGSAATLIRFSAPSEIAGTGLLSLGDGAENSDQWVFLPARQMTRRVPGGRQGGRFAGSDFFYEDLRDRHVDLDTHRWLRQDHLDGHELELIESVPINEDSSVYAGRVLWIDTERWLPLRVDFYLRGQSEPAKVYRIIAVEQHDDRWVISESVMEDRSERHQTRLVTAAWRFDAALPDELFTRRALEDPAIEAAYRP